MDIGTSFKVNPQTTELVKPTVRALDHPAEDAQTAGGFQAFVPLAFHPENTQLPHLRRPSGLEDLRVMAVSRLMLDNFDHLKAYWISLGVGTAQTALGYGADDLDGTVRQERIHHAAGAQSPEVLTVDELWALITEAGRVPVERDSLYHRVRRNGADWEVQV
jgi:aminodeoxyfutalosine synthase